MDLKEQYYPEVAFGGFTYIDGTIAFYSRVSALLTSGSVVVDFGCGRGAYLDDPVAYRRNLHTVRGKVAKVIGLDVSEEIFHNKAIDEAHVINGDTWPLADRSVSLVLCDHVLEHLPSPSSFFCEVRRVLKPGGFLCIRTTNKYSYIGVASRLIPNRWHSKLLTKVQERKKGEDVFPTFYRCNSLWSLKSALVRHGFKKVVVTGYEAEPSYLGFSRVAYYLGTIHQVLSPKPVKPALFAFARTAEQPGSLPATSALL